MLGFFKRLFGIPPVAQAAALAPVAQAAARPFSDAEAAARIRNLLNSERYKFRTLDRLSRAIGRNWIGTEAVIRGMADVRPSRSNYRREMGKWLYTFAE